MAITIDDFSKIWASTSPLTPYEFSENNYKQGWDFVGATPPSRQMWDSLQKNNDEKSQYLLNNFDNYLPLSGGTLTGDVDITGDLSVSGAIYSSDPASGENSGQVPTTAWVQKLLADALTQAKLDAHPVGSYYWSNDSTNPATLFGGTWEALPAGYTLIAQGSGTDDFGSFNYVAGTKYGERMHKLTTDEMPNHSHTLNRNSDTGTGSWCLIDHQSVTKWQTGNVGATGGNQPHENLPPMVAAFAWKRTA